MNDVRAEMLDELLGKKLQTREGRKKVAMMAASYLRDFVNWEPNLGNKMLPRFARILDAFAETHDSAGSIIKMDKVGEYITVTVEYPPFLASELEGENSTLPPCIANQVREKLCEQSSEQSPG